MPHGIKRPKLVKDIVCTIVFLVRGDEILLAMKQRGIGAGYWNGPGGKVDPGESIEHAMIRECQEEVSVTPTTYEKVAYHDFILQNDEGSWHQWTHAYVATEWEGEPMPSDEMLPKWFNQANIPYDQMWPDDILWLPQVLDGKLLQTRFVLAKDEQVEQYEITEVTTL